MHGLYEEKDLHFERASDKRRVYWTNLMSLIIMRTRENIKQQNHETKLDSSIVSQL